MATHRCRGSLLALLVCVLSACTDAGLQPQPPEVPEPLDNLLRLEGQFCTRPTATVTFPVKVLYVIDQSASLQCTDSQNRRFGALNDSVNELRRQSNTEFAFIGFSSWSRELSFTRNRDEMAPFLDPAGGLGPATDYQGALATAVRILEQDMLEEGPAERARSRYVVVFVSDGVPEPRCNPGCEDDRDACGDGEDNDGDGRTDGQDENCANIGDNSVHPDNLYAVCNTDLEIPDDVYVDMAGICPEYNQPPQVLQRVQELVDLKETYSVGDVTLNTVLLFSPQEVVEARCPNAGAAFGYRKDEAQAMLKQMADVGNGVFRDVNVEYQGDNFLHFELTSIQAEQTMTNFMAINQHASGGIAALTPDSDVDGLSDSEEDALHTGRNDRDSDNDRYRDAYEVRLRDRGFDALSALLPAIACDDGADRDGDGLNDCEETFLGTDVTHPDSDGDGITDWIEFLFGTNPVLHDAQADLDFDGTLNIDEIRGGTHPLKPDRDAYRSSRVLYGLEDLGLMEFENPDNGNVEERHCYDFSASRIPLVVTPRPDDRGINRILLYAFEGPARVSGVPGDVRLACFESYYLGGDSKNPASGIIDVSQEALDAARTGLQRSLDELAFCPEFNDPAAVDRDAVIGMVSKCVGRKVELDRRLFTVAELNDMLVRYVQPNLVADIPETAFRLFVPIQSFSTNNHCYRPWEYERVHDYLEFLRQACEACSEPAAGEDVNPTD